MMWKRQRFRPADSKNARRHNQTKPQTSKLIPYNSPRRESNPPEAPPDRREGTPRRESDPPEAPCQANRKEGAGATGHLTRLLGAVPPQGQPPNQASSNHTMRLRLSPMQKNRAQAVQAALGERSPSD